jgi:hypothetical protein
MMTQKDNQQDETSDKADAPWKGFGEIDRAVAENRLTEYRWKKAWADPWGRRLFIGVASIFVAFIAFVIYDDMLKP